MNQAVIVSAVRTPIGSFNGALSSLSAVQLGSSVIAEAVKRSSILREKVQEVIMGNVLSAGLGQAPARQSAIDAGLPQSVHCLTINKICGSSLKAVMLAAQAIRADDVETVVAGGMESMSNAPYLLEKARMGYRMGDGRIVDSMIKDGLWDAYENRHMGALAERCSRKFQITREMCDRFAEQSYGKAMDAQKKGLFDDEIVPLEVIVKKENVHITEDEEPKKFDSKKAANLASIFEAGGTVTAANASSISDGASALVITSERRANTMEVAPLARIVGYISVSGNPSCFDMTPVAAIHGLLKKMNMNIDEVDLFEINEAFSVSSLSVIRELDIDPEKVNVHGGSVALGHPIGATGARCLTTLLHAMRMKRNRFGIVAICIGGGEGVALMVECP